MRLRCPKPDSLMEFVTVPSEMSRWKRFSFRAHTLACKPCQEKISVIQTKWNSYFRPEPDVTSSLIKVYSRLQKDETLILKGWKLDGVKPAAPSISTSLLRQGWVFRGGVSMGLASILLLLVFSQVRTENEGPMTAAMTHSANLPLAQFRVEDKNSIKVHYVQPELLQSMEFETTSGEVR